MKERMDLEICKIRQPNECRQIVDQNVANIWTRRFPTSHRNSFYPIRCKRWRVFLIEEFTEDTLRETFQCDRMIAEMGQQIFRAANVVVDHVRFSELPSRIKNLVEVRDWNALPADFQLCLTCHQKSLQHTESNVCFPPKCQR